MPRPAGTLDLRGEGWVMGGREVVQAAWSVHPDPASLGKCANDGAVGH